MKKQGKTKRWCTVLRSAAIIVIIMGLALFFTVHACSLTKYPQTVSDVIIVLGARVMPDGEMSTTLEHRIESAYKAYEDGLSDSFIVCGAQGSDEPETEAAAMAGYLSERGVDEKSIFIEDKSTDTIENLTHAKMIMEENGFKTALLVTSDYHVTRALWLCSRVGIEAVGYPALGPDLLHNRLIARAKESLSWIKYFLLYRD